MSLANLEPNLESKIKQIYSLSPFKCSVYIAVCVCVCDINLSSLCGPMRL